MSRGIYNRLKTNYFKENSCYCQYCGLECHSQNQLKQHEIRCEKNPNHIVRKKYICQYCGKECNGENSYKLHEQKCHFNPINNKYVSKTTDELIEICLPYKSISQVKKAGYSQIIEVLQFRNSMPEFLNSMNRPLKNKSTEELLDKIEKYNHKSEVIKAGLEKVINELDYRHELPKRFKIHNQLSKYSSMKEDDVLEIAKKKFIGKSIEEAKNIDEKLCNYILRRKHLCWKIFEKDTRYIPKNKKDVYNVILNNFPGIILPKFDSEYKYFKSSVITCIYNGKTYLKNCKALYTGYGGFNGNNQGIRTKKLWNNEKLNILTQYDLLSMSWSVILDLIGEDKLPKEFSQLCKFGENTPERKKMIKDLIDTYNIEVDNEDVENNNDNIIDNDANDINIDIKTKVNNIDDEIYDDIYNEDELKPYKEIKDIGELLDKDFDDILFSTGDKWVHIMSKEISRLWNNVLRDNENHNENTINEIHQKLMNNSLTKFEKHVYEEFLKEYEEVINLEIH